MNGRQYGGGAVMAPGARLDDGLMQIVIIEDASLPELLWGAPRLFLGNIERFARYRCLVAAQATLRGPATFDHHRDGEPEDEACAIEVRVEPRALQMLVPALAANDPNGPFGG
jgi:diacylglycerol kinase family enzyme